MSGIVKREIFATSEIRDYLRWPLKSLELDGVISVIDSKFIDVSPYLSIHFARSEHGQRAIWPIVSHSKYRERLLTTPANTLTGEIREKVISGIQEILNSLSWQGSGLARFNDSGEFIDVIRGCQRESMWTLDTSITSQFENEVRSSFNLPLGDISMRDASWMTLEFSAPTELDMFRPYLHLCARNPGYKFHHYDSHSGVIFLSGEEREIREDLEHAVDYLEGVINE